MKYITIIATQLRDRPSFYFFVFLIIFTFVKHKDLEHNIGPFPPIVSDVHEYYRFLPDIFLSDIPEAEQAIRENKRTLGMAIMYSPAFFTGHLIAKCTGEAADGYSLPYRWALRWGSIIYVLLGLAFLRKTLLHYFREWIVTITLICVFFGTNLYYYTYSAGEMPHSYLFFLFAALMWMVVRWIRQDHRSAFLWIGFIAGMIVLIRPTDIIILLLVLLFAVSSINDLKQRVRKIFADRSILAGAFFLFALPLAVQMIFWKIHHGQFVYYSYGDERFFFNDPQVINFLFSFRKGWLLYTPMMIFALIGMVLAWKRLPDLNYFLVIYLALQIYICSSWWDWAFGGTFGCRVLIESYAVLALPFAVTMNAIWKEGSYSFWRRAGKVTAAIILVSLVRLNTWQSLLYRAGVIHWNGMNRKTYMFILTHNEFRTEDYKYLNDNFTPPDPADMMAGKRDE